jgi:hypothetical protein
MLRGSGSCQDGSIISEFFFGNVNIWKAASGSRSIPAKLNLPIATHPGVDDS